MNGLIILIIIVVIYSSINKVKKAKCRVCSWRGSRKLWDQYNGCPNCRTDEAPIDYRE